MTDHPVPADPPSVDEHPLEGGGPFDALLHPEGYLLVSEAELAEALQVAGVDPETDACILDDHHDDEFAGLLWDALAKQQEDRER
jgi:hypothetical protein